MVDIGGWSKERGGTHVHRSGDIGTAILVRESGLASGIRRVEVLAANLLNHAWEQHERLLHLARMVGAPADQIEAKLDVAARRASTRPAARRQTGAAACVRQATSLVDSAVKVGDVNVLAAQVDVTSRDALRDMADQLRQKLGTSVVALAASFEGQQAFVVGASRDAIERGANAGRHSAPGAGRRRGARGEDAGFRPGGVKEAGQLAVALAQVVPLVERAVGGA